MKSYKKLSLKPKKRGKKGENKNRNKGHRNYYGKNYFNHISNPLNINDTSTTYQQFCSVYKELDTEIKWDLSVMQVGFQQYEFWKRQNYRDSNRIFRAVLCESI